MRTIRHTSQFKKDYKCEKRGQHRKTLDADLLGVVAQRANDTPLPESNKDHALAGEWKDHRDCHIRPDLILIYRKPDNETLDLVRLGSHSELSL